MPRYSYRIREGIRIEPEVDGRYRIRVPQSDRVIQLDPSAVAPLLMLDGRRSADEIVFRLGLQGVAISQGSLDIITRSLASVGVLEEVESPWQRLERYPGPSHRCEGCGASCQGHWVGPLQKEFIERTLPRMPMLRTKYPQLADKKPFVRISPEDNALYLNSQSGQCLFLDDQMGCILHSEFGPSEKPTICQKFPYVRVEDGQSTRLGVGLMCLKYHKQVLGEEIEATSSFWDGLNERLDGHLYQYFPPADLVGSADDLGDRLRGSEDAVRVVLEEVVGRKLMPTQVDAARRLESLAYVQLGRLEADLKEDPIVRAVCTCPGVYPDTLRSLRALARKDPYTQRTPLPVKSAGPARTPTRLRMLNDGLARFFFLRQYLLYTDLYHAMACFNLGIWVGLRLAALGEGGDEHFGEILAAWIRALQSPSARVDLFREPGESVQFLGTFLRFWRGQ